MAENPLRKLARLLGGVALYQGPVPHQILGHLLVSNSTSVEMAGANMVVAAGTRGTSGVANVAVRTAAPTLAVTSIIARRERTLKRRVLQVQQQCDRLDHAAQKVRDERAHTDACIKKLIELQKNLEQRPPPQTGASGDSGTAEAALAEREAALVAQREALQSERQRLDHQRDDQDTRERQLEQAGASLEAKALALDDREQAASAREAELEKAGRDLERVRARLDEDEHELHERRLAMLTEAAEGRAELEREVEALREKIAELQAGGGSTSRRAKRAAKKKTARAKKKTSRAKKKTTRRGTEDPPSDDS